MSEDRNSYANITKAIGLFGGVKAFQILINIIRNKFVAILLGPVGMGVVGMITSTIQLISNLTNFGLEVSSVREVSKAYSAGKKDEIGERVTVLRRLVLLTGLLGTALTAIFAPWLSEWSFGNLDYTNSFRIVSVVLFLDQLWVGQKVLLQGTFHYKYMAKASLYGSIVGLFLTVPLYYVFGMKGIVPVIIFTSIINLCLSTYFCNKIPFQKKDISTIETIRRGKQMLILGIAVASTGILDSGKVYALRMVISRLGDISDVGLYTAGIAIVNQYIGMILMSMASDYSPRLASVSDNTQVFIDTINRQMKLLVTLVTPLICLFVIFIKPLTWLLYSDKFLPITGMLEWMMIAMSFRAVAWSISFGYVARGDAKIFFWSEVLTSVLSLGLSIVGYLRRGFEGMGIAFCFNYILYCAIHYVLSRCRYGFRITNEVVRVVAPQILMSVTLFVLMRLSGYSILRYIEGTLGFIVISIFTYRYLDDMIGIKSTFTKLKNKIK